MGIDLAELQARRAGLKPPGASPSTGARAAEEYLPPPAFRFRVSIAASRVDASFSEISGLKASWKTDSWHEGGQNRFVHQLPVNMEYDPLVLKRGVVLRDSPLAEWVKQTLSADFLTQKLQPRDLVVMLTDVGGDPLVQWNVVRAVPISLAHSELQAAESKLMIETLELRYDWFERRVWPPKGG